MTDTRRRVKVFEMGPESDWMERGIGEVISFGMDDPKSRRLVVRSESHGSLILESEIQYNIEYSKQRDTLIIWSESKNLDLALSFQDKAGCDEIWENICKILGRDPMQKSEGNEGFTLPRCELESLEEIDVLLEGNLDDAAWKKSLISAMKNDGYIKKLLDLFHVCEDLNNIKGLHRLYRIFKNIFLLNKSSLFAILLSEDNILSTIGCFEYDPNSPVPHKHRQYLEQLACFKEIIPLNNQELLTLIHQSFRIQYIQDIILPKIAFLENNHLPSLSKYLSQIKTEIVSQILHDHRLLTELFVLLLSESTCVQVRRDLLLFLKEFYGLSHNLMPSELQSFHETMITRGILQVLEKTLGDADYETKNASIYILTCIVDCASPSVRNYLLHHGNEAEGCHKLISVMIDEVISDDVGAPENLLAILKILLDPANMTTSEEKVDFLKYFYKCCIDCFAAPVLENTQGHHPIKDDGKTAQILALILELLTFCVQEHPYYMKVYIFKSDLLRRVLVLLKSKHTFLVLHVLKFVRSIIALKDDFYTCHIIHNNLFEPIISLYLRNNGRYNLLDSTVLEMFEYIKYENITPLCLHISEKYGEKLCTFDYVQTFKELKLKYDQFRLEMEGSDKSPTGKETENPWMEHKMEENAKIIAANNLFCSKFHSKLHSFSETVVMKNISQAGDIFIDFNGKASDSVFPVTDDMKCVIF